MVIETNKSGIDETFNLKNYARIGIQKKIAKLSTIRLLPEIIKNGKLIADDVSNQYSNGENKKFAYITYYAEIDGNSVTLKLDIKKSPQKNKFWVHRVELIENANDFPASTDNGTEAGQTTVGNGNIIPQAAEFVKPSEEKSKKYSAHRRNNDRDILANVLADSKLNRTKKGLYLKMDRSPFIIYGKISENCLFILSIVT